LPLSVVTQCAAVRRTVVEMSSAVQDPPSGPLAWNTTTAESPVSTVPPMSWSELVESSLAEEEREHPIDVAARSAARTARSISRRCASYEPPFAHVVSDA
jgi:hypothetical protein